jgi:transcriptional regulator with XRE-family HTH domain
MRTNVPIAMRRLRIGRGWRQVDLGTRAGLSRDPVCRAECGELDGMTVGTLSRLTEALEATLVIEMRWQGAALDRMIDRERAHLQDAAARRFLSRGWNVQAEVSFNHYGDRGSCDLVAWHAGTRILLVVEVKSQLGNLQDLLHRLDVKARLGGMLAVQLGWPAPHAVVRGLVLAEDRTARRIIGRHDALFSGFSLRGRGAHAWLRSPSAAAGGLLWFEKPADSGEGRTEMASVVKPGRAAG